MKNVRRRVIDCDTEEIVFSERGPCGGGCQLLVLVRAHKLVNYALHSSRDCRVFEEVMNFMCGDGCDAYVLVCSAEGRYTLGVAGLSHSCGVVVDLWRMHYYACGRALYGRHATPAALESFSGYTGRRCISCSGRIVMVDNGVLSQSGEIAVMRECIFDSDPQRLTVRNSEGRDVHLPTKLAS